MTDPRSTYKWKQIRKVMLERQPYCSVDPSGGSCKGGLEVDHQIAIANGGDPYDEQNLDVLCAWHNNQKNNKVLGQVNDWINKRWLEWEAS